MPANQRIAHHATTKRCDDGQHHGTHQIELLGQGAQRTGQREHRRTEQIKRMNGKWQLNRRPAQAHVI